MAQIGDQFSHLGISLPERSDSAENAEAISDRVQAPLLSSNGGSQRLAQGKVLLALAKGDLQDIGKNMISLVLQVNSFEVIDMAVDVAPREILERAQELEVDIIATSPMTTITRPSPHHPPFHASEAGGQRWMLNWWRLHHPRAGGCDRGRWMRSPCYRPADLCKELGSKE